MTRHRLLLATALLASACGTRPTRPEGEPRALPAQGAFYTPGLPAWAATTGLPATEAERAILTVAQRSVAPPPALDCLAREYAARYAADGASPDPAVVQALADHCGYWTTPAGAQTATAPTLKHLEDWVAKHPAVAAGEVMGLGVAPHPDGKYTIAMLGDRQDVRIDPVPRRSEGPVRLTGRALRKDGTLELWIDDGTAPPRTLPLTTDATGRFEAELPPSPRQRRVELALATDFRETLAVLRAPGPPLTGYPKRARPEQLDGRAVLDGELLAAVNRARAEARRPPVNPAFRHGATLDRWLESLATEGILRAPEGLTDDRGWRYARLRYAFLSGVDGEQAARLLAETPSGRHVLIDEGVDEIAFGIRPFPRGVGFDGVVVALDRFQAVPPAAARTAFLARINALRGQPLVAAPALDAVAQEVAEAAQAGRVPWSEVVQTLMDRVRAERLAAGAFGAGGLTAPLTEEAEVAGETAALEPKMTRVGIGVAGGPMPDGGPPRHIIVYIVAEALPGDG